jgi:hypothetical protein
MPNDNLPSQNMPVLIILLSQNFIIYQQLHKNNYMQLNTLVFVTLISLTYINNFFFSEYLLAALLVTHKVPYYMIELLFIIDVEVHGPNLFSSIFQMFFLYLKPIYNLNKLH